MSNHHDQDCNGGWDGATAAKESAWRATTPAQRLAWLEEALTFAQSVGALDQDRRRRQHEAVEWAAGEPCAPVADDQRS